MATMDTMDTKNKSLLTKLLAMTLKSQMIAIVMLLVVGVSVAIFLGNRSLKDVMIGGQAFEDVAAHKDLAADILPPPAYLLEAWQVSLEIYAMSNEPLKPLIDKGDELSKTFIERAKYWPAVHPELTKDVNKVLSSGEAFIHVRDTEYIPAVLSGDRKQMQTALYHLKQVYLAHRQTIDELVTANEKQYQFLITQELPAKVKKTHTETVLIILVSLGLVLGGILVVVNNVRRQLGGEALDALEAAQKIANGVFVGNSQAKSNGQVSVISALNLAANTLLEIDREMSRIGSEHAKGNTDARINEQAFNGAYREMAKDINQLVGFHISTIKKTSDALAMMAKGDFDANLEALPGELAKLNNSFDTLKHNVSQLITEMNNMSQSHEVGETDVQLDAKNYDGDFKKVADCVNQMVFAHIDEKNEVIALLRDIADGKFDAKAKREYPGNKAEINRQIERVTGKLNGLVESVRWVTSEHEKGDFEVSLHAHLFKGGFHDLATCVNTLIAEQVDLTQKAMACVKAFGEGDFNAKLEQFPGKKASINQTIEQVRSNLKALNDDSQLLANAARQGEVMVRADVNRHLGDYRKIVEGMNDTLDMIVQPIVNVKTATDAINMAAKEIAQGNADLSRRTEDQAASLDKTTSNMHVLANTVKQNAENAKQANQLASVASDVALKGGSAVSEVVNTMSAINESARKIEDIITVIDSIAFQTNILALNAAVEAARAGEQGRGFAVVAGEVGNLAQRSSVAAKEIKDLINESVNKTAEGSKQVSAAGETMQEIVNSVKRVSDIIGEITAASVEQSTGIAEVNEAIMTMDEVTQQNTALVEQAAAAAESLMDQANELANTVSVFNVDGTKQKYTKSESRMVSNAF